MRVICAVLVGLAVGACDDSVAPEDTYGGEYALVSIGGPGLSFRPPTASGDGRRVESGEVSGGGEGGAGGG